MRRFVLLVLIPLTASAADSPWSTDLVSAVRQNYQAPETADCHADVTARVTATGVLLTLDLPTGRRTEQCDEALLGAFRGVEITSPPAALLVDHIATVVVPLGSTPVSVTAGPS